MKTMMNEPKQLPFKELSKTYPDHLVRALFFDPTEVFERVKGHVDHFKRIQPGNLTNITFPRLENVCSCGCGRAIKSGKVRKFALPECAKFTYFVHSVIVGNSSWYSVLVFAYHGHSCAQCGKPERECKGNSSGSTGLHIDHVLPVKHGGGACWLNNLIPLCKECHLDKTHRDFGHGKYKRATPC